jgi:hypothetical protein
MAHDMYLHCHSLRRIPAELHHHQGAYREVPRSKHPALVDDLGMPCYSKEFHAHCCTQDPARHCRVGLSASISHLIVPVVQERRTTCKYTFEYRTWIVLIENFSKLSLTGKQSHS